MQTVLTTDCLVTLECALTGFLVDKIEDLDFTANVIDIRLWIVLRFVS